MSFLQAYNKISKQSSSQLAVADVNMLTSFTSKMPIHAYFNMTEEDFENMSPDLKETFIKNYFESKLFYYSFNNNCLFKYLLIYHDIVKILFSFF